MEQKKKVIDESGLVAANAVCSPAHPVFCCRWRENRLHQQTALNCGVSQGTGYEGHKPDHHFAAYQHVSGNFPSGCRSSLQLTVVYQFAVLVLSYYGLYNELDIPFSVQAFRIIWRPTVAVPCIFNSTCKETTTSRTFNVIHCFVSPISCFSDSKTPRATTFFFRTSFFSRKN